MSSLLRSNVAVATGTALSRVTGVLRVAVLGAVLGAPSALADAYDLANGTPNMIYELLIGGVLSSSLVPLFTRLHEEKDTDGTNAVVSVAVVVMAAITAVAVLAAPLIFRLYSLMTSAAVDAGQYREVGTLLSRIFLVQIFFYGLNALASALLNARSRFFAAAWCSGVHPIRSRRDGSALRRKSSRTITASPRSTARCSGVRAAESGAWTSAPASNSNGTIFTWRRRIA